MYNIILYVVRIASILLFVLAIIWEMADHKRLENIINVNEIKNKKDREIQYKFLAKFPYENAVNWRLTYIASVFTTILLYYILFLFKFRLDTNILFILFFIIFCTFHFTSGFHHFHFYRILANKADPTINIL
jgi:hypothetical protein